MSGVISVLILPAFFMVTGARIIVRYMATYKRQYASYFFGRKKLGYFMPSRTINRARSRIS